MPSFRRTRANRRPRRRYAARRPWGRPGRAAPKGGKRNNRVMGPVHRFTRYTNLSAFGTAGSVGLQFLSNATVTFNSGYLNILVPATTNSYNMFSIAPQLQALPSYAEFTALYDKYRILGFTVMIAPTYNTYSAPIDSFTETGVVFSQNGTVCIPILHSVSDLDDNSTFASTEAGLDAMRQYMTYKMARLDGRNRVWKRSVRFPSVNLAVQEQQAAAVALPIQKRSPWIDCASVDIQHYGLKWCLEILNPTAQQMYINFKVEVKFYMAFTQPR